jgi:lysophospholipase L1-like esterase
VLRTTTGEWSTSTITFGGAQGPRYGLAGLVSTAAGEATSTLGGGKADGKRQLLHRFDVYYQVQPGGGTLKVSSRGGGATLSTAADKQGDRYKEIQAPAGASTLVLSAVGDGPVTVYGAALETAGPGLTWESFGVAGSSIGSLTRQSRAHLSAQVSRRRPDLLVYTTGGNEVGYPSLARGEGEEYRDAWRTALHKLRAGAPEASCLVVSPLDQAVRERGRIQSKPMLTRLVAIQRWTALEEGCAFWDSRAAMGGEGGFLRFLDHEPRRAWTDLIHLTEEGLDLIGQGLADALLASYDAWRTAG